MSDRNGVARISRFINRRSGHEIVRADVDAELVAGFGVTESLVYPNATLNVGIDHRHPEYLAPAWVELR